MTLEYITNSIDKKIYKNKSMVIYTFNELRVREGLSKEETDIFLYYAKIRLENLGYKVFLTGDKFLQNGFEMVIQEDKLIVAVKLFDKAKNKKYI